MLAGKSYHKLAAVFLAAVLALATAAGHTPAQAASSISSLQQKQSQLKKQQSETAAKLKQLKQDRNKQQEYKETLDTQIQNIQSQIDTMNDQIGALNADITSKESQIADKQKDIDKNFEQLKERVRAIYLMGESSNLEIVLGAKDLTDFLDKAELMRSITSHDSEIIDSLKTDLQSIKSQKEQIEANRRQVSEAKKGLDQKNSELSALVNESNQVIQKLNSSVVEANSENNRVAEERKKVDAQIDQWYKDYYASLGDNSDNHASGGYVSKGQFIWPAPGTTKITAYWGDGRGHKGIDIAGAGAYGKPIVAADSGRVMLANHSGWGGGYGLCVYIDHGGGYSTRYGHASKVVVNTGDIVKQGQVIAYIGSTGDSTGPHLHFEIRVNGVAQNPMKWFS